MEGVEVTSKFYQLKVRENFGEAYYEKTISEYIFKNEDQFEKLDWLISESE